jgi:hypothetical protein
MRSAPCLVTGDAARPTAATGARRFGFPGQAGGSRLCNRNARATGRAGRTGSTRRPEKLWTRNRPQAVGPAPLSHPSASAPRRNQIRVESAPLQQASKPRKRSKPTWCITCRTICAIADFRNALDVLNMGVVQSSSSGRTVRPGSLAMLAAMRRALSLVSRYSQQRVGPARSRNRNNQACPFLSRTKA